MTNITPPDSHDPERKDVPQNPLIGAREAHCISAMWPMKKFAPTLSFLA
jgi:hypothetical protein